MEKRMSKSCVSIFLLVIPLVLTALMCCECADGNDDE